MSEQSTNWTKKELKAYLLFYCANANFIESEEEKELIKSNIKDKKLVKIRQEFENDNDYQRIQKIQSTIQEKKYEASEIDSLILEIKDLFLSDGSYDTLEENVFLGLKRILRKI